MFAQCGQVWEAPTSMKLGKTLLKSRIVEGVVVGLFRGLVEDCVRSGGGGGGGGGSGGRTAGRIELMAKNSHTFLRAMHGEWWNVVW